MNKIKIVLIISLFFLNIKIYGLCNNVELNDLAERLNIEYTEDTVEKVKNEDGTFTEYETEDAYRLVFTPYSDKVKITYSDSINGNVREAKYSFSNEKNYIGSYIHYGEKKYNIKVYGSNNSACPNELLKEIAITIPSFNEYSLYKSCYNNDSDLCIKMKDTSSISVNEFLEETKENNKTSDTKNMSIKEKIVYYFIHYVLFILIPIVIVSLVYIIKKRSYKKKVNKR